MEKVQKAANDYLVNIQGCKDLVTMYRNFFAVATVRCNIALHAMLATDCAHNRMDSAVPQYATVPVRGAWRVEGEGGYGQILKNVLTVTPHQHLLNVYLLF